MAPEKSYGQKSMTLSNSNLEKLSDGGHKLENAKSLRYSML